MSNQSILNFIKTSIIDIILFTRKKILARRHFVVGLFWDSLILDIMIWYTFLEIVVNIRMRIGIFDDSRRFKSVFVFELKYGKIWHQSSLSIASQSFVFLHSERSTDHRGTEVTQPGSKRRRAWAMARYESFL